ncbi:MAG: hypothetical protein P8Y97_13885 [Candidatus Lokiarchaeota archaeon]
MRISSTNIKKFSIDPKDRIAIITFGDNTKRLINFSHDEEALLKAQ